jgi:hypothetical protein
LVRLERSRDGVLRIFPSDSLAAELSAKLVSEPAISESPAPQPKPMVAPESAEALPAEVVPEEPTSLDIGLGSSTPEPTESVLESVTGEPAFSLPQTEEKPKRRRRSTPASAPRRRTGSVRRSPVSKRSSN